MLGGLEIKPGFTCYNHKNFKINLSESVHYLLIFLLPLDIALYFRPLLQFTWNVKLRFDCLFALFGPVKIKLPLVLTAFEKFLLDS